MGSEESGIRDFKILGQELSWPRNWAAATSLIALLIFIYLLIRLVLIEAPEGRLSFVTTTVLASTGRVVQAPQKTRIIEFWTPSPATQLTLKDQQGQISEPNRWQVVTDVDVTGFERKLAGSTNVVLGYRHFAVVGHGQTRLKEGLWWVVRVRPEMQLTEFVKIYSQHWHNTADVYFEETGGSSSYVSSAK